MHFLSSKKRPVTYKSFDPFAQTNSSEIEDVFISVDVETDGPIPGEYSMLSIGAVSCTNTLDQFYTEIRPLAGARSDPEALKVSGLDLAKLGVYGEHPRAAMYEFKEYIERVSCVRNPTRKTVRPVFVAFNATFDWSFVNWYFHKFIGSNPFGIAGLDIKAYYMGKAHKNWWKETTKKRIPKKFMSVLPHTHNAREDALEQAELFRNIVRWDGND